MKLADLNSDWQEPTQVINAVWLDHRFILRFADSTPKQKRVRAIYEWGRCDLLPFDKVVEMVKLATEDHL